MSDIKFRAWDKKDEVMVAFDHSNFAVVSEQVRNYALGYDSEGNYRQQDNITYMQYTGLKDKNGVEIYESDIVSTDSGMRIVEYIAPEFCMCKPEHSDSRKSGRFGSYYIDSDTFSTPGAFEEVIGNIYEHSHLLEANQ